MIYFSVDLFGSYKDNMKFLENTFDLGYLTGGSVEKKIPPKGVRSGKLIISGCSCQTEKGKCNNRDLTYFDLGIIKGLARIQKIKITIRKRKNKD